ncbi:MAG: hypothetical protein MK132_05235 [Lentisphaerales bacterium]|nr:hypothetical protein [Lentisphaerales bacterium]
MKTLLQLLSILILFATTAYPQAEDAVKMKGVKINLISEADAISPNTSFTVAIHIQHFDGFHTYWKNPGMVGVATKIDWTLPEGFKAGEIQWQVPERSKMLKYNCHGYKGETYLLVDIQAGADIPESFDIEAKVGGMTCSEKSCCFVGFAQTKISLNRDTETKLNSKHHKIIQAARDRIPKLIEKWQSSFQQTDSEIILAVHNSEFTKDIPQDLYFYPEQNVYNTETPQEVVITTDNSINVRFQLSVIAEKNLKSLSGFLYNPKGWSSNDDKYLRVEAKVSAKN